MKFFESLLTHVQAKSSTSKKFKPSYTANILEDVLSCFFLDKSNGDNKILTLPNVKEMRNYNIDDLINGVTNTLNLLQTQRKSTLNSLIKNINLSNLICNDGTMEDQDTSNIMQDMEYHSNTIKQFLKYLEKDNAKRATNTNIDNYNFDDVVCSICNDGNYEDNDLIVFCSVKY